MSERRTLDDLLEGARARITRREPDDAFAAVEAGALLVDIRSDLDREQDGIVPGSIHVPRTVLEWRFDPDSAWRSPYACGLDEPLLLICDHGYSSSLAAAVLADLGFMRVGDVIGGFAAWRDGGLPVANFTALPRRADLLPGMGPPA